MKHDNTTITTHDNTTKQYNNTNVSKLKQYSNNNFNNINHKNDYNDHSDGKINPNKTGGDLISFLNTSPGICQPQNSPKSSRCHTNIAAVNMMKLEPILMQKVEQEMSKNQFTVRNLVSVDRGAEEGHIRRPKLVHHQEYC